MIADFASLLSSIVYLYLDYAQFLVLRDWILFVHFMTTIFCLFISHLYVLYHKSVTKIHFALLNRCTSKLNQRCVSVCTISKVKSVASSTAVSYVFGVHARACWALSTLHPPYFQLYYLVNVAVLTWFDYCLTFHYIINERTEHHNTS